MYRFEEIEKNEMESINGGGLLSCAAGALAGALIGSIVALPGAAISGKPSAVGHGAILGASAGAFVGGYAPAP